MKRLTKGIITALATLSCSANAAVGEHPVILIHGFQAGQLQTKPDSLEVETDGAAYWRDYWLAKADDRIDWPSHERVAGKISTDYIWPKLQELSRKQTCLKGCIFVTHSTGDLVARYMIDNQANWLENSGLQPLNIIATFDFAGAGGGSELGDLAINVAEGSGWINAGLKSAIKLWLGEIPDSKNTGVLNDLKVANARQLSPMPEGRVPRVRFTGDGSDFFQLTAGFLPGHDDGVVASHSSCGASRAGDFNSCSVSIAYDGKLAPQSNGVSDFMPDHYPLLMGEGYSHGGLISNAYSGQVTAAKPQVMLTNGKALTVNSTDEKYWLTGYYYRYVDGSENQTMSQLATELLN
ncbi:hypothetical protein MD588_13885 [Photobacterium sp. SDRW27]|uniref:hypothetical protein n=1 Tax=Photobacterium obscurum TaxID=2829490 RepID=UPI002242EC3E|nr:hypothetical protein [Photobacterium obscurum]MCW8329896.1 hypothetical protein [Photobacterium obscurum]